MLHIIFTAEVYLPFDHISNDVVKGGTSDGTFLEGTSAAIEPGIFGNALVLNRSIVSIGDKRDSCFWLPNLCEVGMSYALWIKLGKLSHIFSLL